MDVQFLLLSASEPCSQRNSSSGSQGEMKLVRSDENNQPINQPTNQSTNLLKSETLLAKKCRFLAEIPQDYIISGCLE